MASPRLSKRKTAVKSGSYVQMQRPDNSCNVPQQMISDQPPPLPKERKKHPGLPHPPGGPPAVHQSQGSPKVPRRLPSQTSKDQPDSGPPPLPPKEPIRQDPRSPPIIPRKPIKLPSPPPPLRTRPPPYKSISKSYTLEECIQKAKLPIMIRVVSGIFDAMEERRTIPTDQEFVAYFQKRTKVVRAKPEDYMRMYSIPINSAIKFIPLYEEDSKFSHAPWEGDFDNVADLHKLEKLPKVLVVTRDITDTNKKRLKSGACLFQLEKKMKKGERGIKAVDHLGQKHYFFENERVFFSSRRDRIKMFVYEFSKFITFPVKVQARVPVEVENLMRAEALGSEQFIEDFSILTFEKLEDETTIVVNTDISNLSNRQTNMDYIMELPTDLDIEVEIIEFEEEKYQREMYEAVVHSYEIFGTGNKNCENPYSSSGQKVLNSNVDSTYEGATELDDIDHVYDYISSKSLLRMAKNVKKSAAVTPETALMGPGPSHFPRPSRSAKDLPLPLPPVEQSVEPQVPQITPLPPRNTEAVSRSPRNISALSPIIPIPPRGSMSSDGQSPASSVLSCSVPQLPYEPMRLNDDSDGSDVDEYVEPMILPAPTPKEERNVPATQFPFDSKTAITSPNQEPPLKGNNEDNCEMHRHYLRSLNHIKVLQLLDLMGLSQYRDNFIKEHIDGEVLVDLGEEELKDLGVISKIHTLRLKKIIEGKIPSQKYLEEGNPYGSL